MSTKLLLHTCLCGFATVLMGTVAVAQAPAVATGALALGQFQVYPQGCVHSGNRAVCTFVAVNQGQLATLNAWGGYGNPITGIQFVDSGHVPHAGDKGYFLDTYSTIQNQLVMQHAEQGTLVIEYPNVDPRVVSGGFQWQSQITGTVAVTQPTYTPSQAPVANIYQGAPAQQPAPQNVVQQQQPVYAQPQPQQQVQPQPVYATANAHSNQPVYSQPVNQAVAMSQVQMTDQQQQQQLAPACLQPQNANSTTCKVQSTLNSTQNGVNTVNNTAGQATTTINQTTETVKQIGGLFGALKGLMPTKPDAPANEQKAPQEK